MLNALRRMADVDATDSLANRMRRKRTRFFLEMAAEHPDGLTVLDVGGRESYWEQMGLLDTPGLQLTLLNLDAPPARAANVTSRTGSATDLSSLPDDAYDLVFSNSVIEHVGDLHQQLLAAREMQRVGRRFLVQTPNRFFVLEPHFLVPFFGVLPATSRVWVLTHVRTRRHPVDTATAVMLHSNHRLLTRGELRLLFPGARVERERIAGLTKSFVVIGPRAAAARRCARRRD